MQTDSYDLTNREHEVLKCLVQGKSNIQISDQLKITVATVKAHISSILEKLEVEDRTQAAIKSIRENLV